MISAETIITPETMITVAALKARGWTDAGIKKFLGPEDATRDNPMYRSAAPMRLYNVRRVQAAEVSSAYKEWQLASDKRKASARRAIQTKTDNLVSSVQALTITIRQVARGELTTQAIEHFNARARFDADRADANSNPDFLQRITVNYLRHQCSHYDHWLRNLTGHTGRNEAHDLFAKRSTAPSLTSTQTCIWSVAVSSMPVAAETRCSHERP